MYGEKILVRWLSKPTIEDRHNNVWQYHPQSDAHSKVACWGVMFDLLLNCPLLRSHISKGKVAFGINHRITDYVTQRSKDLDLVLSIPQDSGSVSTETFRDFVAKYKIDLTSEEKRKLQGLPVLQKKDVGDLLMALESKACMTAHAKARPRLFDELTSAAQCINGSSPRAIAVGHTIVNAEPNFLSPKRNKRDLSRNTPDVAAQRQPYQAVETQKKIKQVVVRPAPGQVGFDAMSITTVKGKNDGTPFVMAGSKVALSKNDSHNYDRMIQRVGAHYANRFSNI